MKKSGCLSTVAIIAGIILLIKIAPMLFTIIKIGLILSIVGIVAVVVLVIYFSLRKDDKDDKDEKKTADDSKPQADESTKEDPPEEPSPTLTEEQNEILKNGRAHLTEIRRRMTHIGNIPIRTVCGNICTEVEKILRTLREKPELIPRVRQFLNYYLPTLSSILETYIRLEQGGVAGDDISDNTLEHLIDIKHAMERQYEALFDDDKLDLTVEMEALKIACLRDGLLTEDDFQSKTENDTKPNLTL